jgi:signal transduction histidine kinase
MNRWLRFDIALYLSLVIATAAVSLPAIIAGAGIRWMALGVFGAFAGLLALSPRVEHNSRWTQIYLLAQTLLIIGLASLQPGLFTFIFLGFVLCLQATLLMPLKLAGMWVTLFMLITLVSAVSVEGWRGAFTALLNVLGYPLCLAFGIVLRRAEEARRHNQQLLEELQATQRQLQGLAIAEERKRLARDLHDSVKQQIFAAAMQLGAARELMDRDPQSAKTHIAEAEQLTTQARDELTGLIHELRPAALEGKGLAEALREYVAGWSRRTHINTDMRVQGERAFPLDIEQTLFRVAQEALANVARHSRATKAAVQLIYENDSAMLTVADNGQGFEAEALNRRGVGLSSMRERMESLGGKLQVTSQPDGGTRIIAYCHSAKKPGF